LKAFRWLAILVLSGTLIAFWLASIPGWLAYP